MKNKIFNPGIIIIISIFFFTLSSCEEELSIPEASTQADFTYEFESVTNPETGLINYEVSFTNTSINAAGYHWDFGDGETSTEENPVHIYDEDGLFEVTLTVTPEKELHYNSLEKTERLTLVSTLLYEGFDDPDLETNFPPEGWTLIDLDGDDHNWYWDTTEGEYYILSDSWYESEGTALTPDNWIITPEIDMSDAAGANLEYEVTPRANGPEYRTEKYAVMVSTTGTDVEDFEIVFEERLTEDMENWVWVLRSVDLNQFAGEKIYIAFRHYDSTDLWSIALTNIHVYETGGDK
ncbi:MAG: choice-of-anchor J domain-containing protein [Bacteroidota bacterium]